MKKALKILALSMVTLMVCLALASCGAPNADPDKALETLKENGVLFAVKDERAIPAALKLAGVDGVDCVVSGTGKIDEKYAHITIIYFDSTDSAKDAWKKVQDRSEEAKKDADEDSEWVCEKSGKMIYYGTEAAVKASK